MLIWYFLLGALAVFTALLLFGFVGCGLDAIGTGGAEDYPTTILQTPGLVAYWRLQEPSSTPVPSTGGSAKCENTSTFNGDYFKLNPTALPDEQHQSDQTAGTTADEIKLGVTPGLLELLPTSTCLEVDGGYVQVPFHAQLNPAAFTLEVWIQFPFPGIHGTHVYYQCIAESTGPTGLGQRQSGWGIYLGPQFPHSPPGSDLFWTIWMFDDTNEFHQVATSTHPASTDLVTYLVLTYDGLSNLQLFRYYPNTDHQLDIPSIREIQVNVTGFKPNDSGNFFIGTGSNLFPAAGVPPQRLYPYRGKIQEVALYNIDLSGVNNAGVSSTLGPHEAAGGNF